MSAYSGRHRQRSLRAPLTLLALLLAALGLLVPAASGGFTARVANTGNAATTATYFTCGNAVNGTPKAYFAYAFGESGGLTAADATGNNRPGSYSSLLNAGITPVGVTYGQANSGSDAVCPRDRQTTIRLNGSSGFVSGPNAQMTGPNVFSVEIWFRTASPQGKLIGFGNQRTTSSSNYDRHLYIDASGKLVFGVYPNAVRTLASPNPVTDNAWHQAVGTLSGAGMALYLDGKLVASDASTTTAQSFSGFWRIGWDNIANWPNPPANQYFNGSLAFAAVYTDALTAAQVAAHYVAGD